jgi:predicted nucleic acid-binding protein
MKTPTKPIVLDNNVLVAWCDDKASDRTRKLDYLLSQARDNRQRIIIPTPVLAEFLALAGEARRDFLEQLRRSPTVTIEPFDEPAAIEASFFADAAIKSGDKKYGTDEPMQKIKVDTQIVAVAKVHDAALIVSGDKGIHKIGRTAAINVSFIDDLSLPPEDPQGSLLANI